MPFYVYQLVDPRDGLPFYVGKGTGRRAWQHQAEVLRGVGGINSRKIDRIRSILIAGQEVRVDILGNYESEADALDHEWRLIDQMPTLTNMVAGGGGRCLTQAQVEARRIARQSRIAGIQERERQVSARLRLEHKRRSFIAAGRSAEEFDQIHDWTEKHSAQLRKRPFYERRAAAIKALQAQAVPPPVYISLAEAKAIYVETGSMPTGMKAGAKQRLRAWAKRRKAAIEKALHAVA